MRNGATHDTINCWFSGPADAAKPPEEPDGKQVTYSLVRFGSYPQSEIMPEPDEAGTDSIADRDLYEKLETAEWGDGPCEVDGRRYIRVFSPGENTGRLG